MPTLVYQTIPILNCSNLHERSIAAGLFLHFQNDDPLNLGSIQDLTDHLFITLIDTLF